MTYPIERLAELRRHLDHLRDVRPQVTGPELLERVMHSGALTERAGSAMVIPAYAGIQALPMRWIPACAGMTCHLCLPVRLATFTMHNTL
jgi:hypothetical protein